MAKSVIAHKTIPPFNSLRAFESTARHMSLSRAAEELNVSRGAISQQIKVLETFLEQKLLVRNGSQIALTEQAMTYLPLLTDTFKNLSVGTQNLFGGNASHTLTIRVAQSFCNAWLLGRLADFQRKYPLIKLKFFSTVNLYPSEEQAVDIEIINGYGNWSNRKAEQLTQHEEWVVVASRGYISRYDLSQSVETIATYPKIGTIGYSEGWKDWFNLHSSGMPFTEPLLEFDSTQLSMEAAGQGLGMLLAKTILVEDALKAGDLVVVHPRRMQSQSHHYLIVNPNSQNQYKVMQFTQWLLSTFED
ncbi:LysR substrate-binding domain-containing protein [Aliagarivorans marinus]|uniref:LysR substrate-binding domain-containing protein n=1 Tax=Aliagarivorans marinus TaxID=561965 RepID=UPI0003FD6CF5|nr:LysR substrate-binding domain-containing protein [Aliagarivorans marinus]